MSRTAFIFPGQGAQFVGMGQEFYENFPLAKSLYDTADEILGFSVTKISFEGPEEELKQTRITQPAIFTLSVIIAKLLQEKAIYPQLTAGHSLGEYAALVTADAIDFEDALKLVKLRGELMQKSGEDNPGTMAAIIGLSPEDVTEIISEFEEDEEVELTILRKGKTQKIKAVLADRKDFNKLLFAPHGVSSKQIKIGKDNKLIQIFENDRGKKPEKQIKIKTGKKIKNLHGTI